MSELRGVPGGTYQRLAREQLVSGSAAARPVLSTYASRFGRWDDLASVRRKPRRHLVDPADLYFPPELYPVVSHPLVVARGPAVVRTLLLHRLYDYLDFTTELENLAVIPVAAKIARGTSGLLLPRQMRADAFKIVTDEAWHAQFSYDFIQELEHVTGVPRGGGGIPVFAQRLDGVVALLPREVAGLEALVFAIVSETLISGILSELPRDERLPRPVRDLVRDHAEDEGRHHVYFRSVLRHLWPALTLRERRAVGPHVPAIIQAFLTPDQAQVATRLAAVGLSDEEIVQVVTECWPEHELTRATAESAAPAVRYFIEVGALDDSRTRCAFMEAGLLADDAGSDTGGSGRLLEVVSRTPRDSNTPRS
ncbi:diiron oxygenase [Streptomyces sp. NBC_01136]|uniref:diiron oxygenase n=1 Tax=unclassified Streptomyces TaxID=2593676 RepID=UPI0032504B89|nr:diiron oxygenase [Streptomyces sp. NBC_01136]